MGARACGSVHRRFIPFEGGIAILLCSHHGVFAHSCADGVLGPFDLLAIVNSAAVHVGVHVR